MNGKGTWGKPRIQVRRVLSRTLCAAVASAVMGMMGTPLGAQTGFLPEKAAFSVKLKGQVSPYRVLGVYLLPEESIALEVLVRDGEPGFRLESAAGESTQRGEGAWNWKAPLQTGLYEVKIVGPDGRDSVTLNMFVMVPFKKLKGSHLNGYRIGSYPEKPWKGLEIYRPPRGFIEVTPENEETLISPHFRLKQFLSKQASGYPKYVVLKERLLLKLELILEEANRKGYHANSFVVMSGYRTPFYNKAIGNVKYSRHVWGGAADIFIDESPKDEVMDDLNRDGKINVHDAGVLYDLIDAMFGKTWYEPFVGGLGRYEKTQAHGPFVHVDVRGFRARWGN